MKEWIFWVKPDILAEDYISGKTWEIQLWKGLYFIHINILLLNVPSLKQGHSNSGWGLPKGLWVSGLVWHIGRMVAGLKMCHADLLQERTHWPVQRLWSVDSLIAKSFRPASTFELRSSWQVSLKFVIIFSKLKDFIHKLIYSSFI